MVRVASLAAFPRSEITREFYCGIVVQDDAQTRREIRLRKDRSRKRIRRLTEKSVKKNS